MRKSFKKIVAVAMAATMVLGSNVVAFADDANSATGTGTNTGHLDTNVVIAVLPTTTDVNGVFNFTIDPENILATADKFTDGTTAAGADFKNSDLVYFKQANGAEKAYASSSQTVSVKAKNYVAADVSVAATVADAADGKTTIPLVADADALSAATTPSLLLTLKVGTKTAAITADGATVSDTIAAQDGKFDVKRQADGSYKVDPKTGDSITWDGVNVQLTGKVKGGDVDSTIAAPNVTLTWTVAAHVDGPSAAQSSYTKGDNTSIAVTVNNLGQDTIASVKEETDTELLTWGATVNNGVITLNADYLQYVTASRTINVTTTAGKTFSFTVAP